MIGRRNGLRLGATASAWLVCSAVAAVAAPARDPGDDRPWRGKEGGPRDGPGDCPLCSRGLECAQHLV